ncbi:MAG: Nramp family divalent metal transporter [Deltaproteobacteria bacterium]|jgi:NRAMP (natural resistance-associated macrophage protein)-like metal ion transporter|nr:Nramp family divalent metal transporter [Deltaproteobacteria bacterium]
MSRQGYWRRLALILAVIGPGIITSNVDNDAGGITTYSLAGSEFGLRLLWIMLPITGALILIQEMSARMGVVSGKGLAALIREQFGAAVTFYLMICIVLTNLANTVAEFAGVVASLELFSVPRYYSAPLAAFLVWFLVLKGSYKTVEKVFLGACVFYVAYIVSGFLAKPDWGAVSREILTPRPDFSTAALTMVIGLVGTTIAPWMQFYLQAAVVDKGLTAKDYRIIRWDVIVGSVTVSLIAFFIILVCAITIHAHGIHIESAKEAALALVPLAGKYAADLFALGLLNASLFAASILPLSTAYTVCEAFGWESSVDCKFEEAPQFYILYSLMIVLGAGLVMIPNVPLIPIMYFSQVLNGVVLPIILFFMIRLINDPSVMGEHVNSRFSNILTWVTAGVFSLLSITTAVTLIW